MTRLIGVPYFIFKKQVVGLRTHFLQNMPGLVVYRFLK